MPTTPPHTDGAGALARLREDVGDDGHRDGVEHGGADGLHHPEGDQRAQPGCQAAEQGASGEDHQPGLERPPPTEPVSRGAGQHEQAGQHEDVSVDRPLQTRQRHVQVAPDRGQRDVHDRDVHADQQQAHATDGQDKQAATLTQLRHSHQQ
jgi:hypothetical protein